MEPSGHSGPDPSDAELLRRLEERLDRASNAAERLIVEAARASASSVERLADAAGRAARSAGSPEADRGSPPGSPSEARASGDPPAAGWQVRDGGEPAGDLDVLAQFLRSVGELVPPEL